MKPGGVKTETGIVVAAMVGGVVGHDDTTIKETVMDGENGKRVEIVVEAKEKDLGLLAGKQFETLKAIRRIAFATAGRAGVRLYLYFPDFDRNKARN